MMTLNTFKRNLVLDWIYKNHHKEDYFEEWKNFENTLGYLRFLKSYKTWSSKEWH